MRAALCVLVLLLTAALAGPVAAADPAPQVTDIAGDANAVNGQGLVTGVGQVTPVDYAPADLISVRYETTFEEVPVGGDGIDYRVTGLRAHIVTSAPAKSDGPTLIYRLNVDVGNCGGFLQHYLAGPASAPIDKNKLEFRQFASRGCAADATVIPPSWTVSFDGTTMSYNMPLEGLPASDRINFAEGKSIATTAAEVRTLLVAATAPAIDVTDSGTTFKIGSDMPKDVPCTVDCP